MAGLIRAFTVWAAEPGEAGSATGGAQPTPRRPGGAIAVGGGRLATVVITALLLLAPAASNAAGAADYPPRKAGLWEMTIDTGRGPPQMARYCVDAATDAALQKMGQGSMGQMCSRFELHRSGATMTADAVCRMGDTQVTTHSVTTFTANTATHTVATSRFDPPMQGGMAEARMTQDGRWIGPCDSDMQPGDMVINGNKMHMPTGANGKAP